MNDVARVAGVSNATVSRVLSRPDSVKAETRDHIIGVMKRLGYRVNQAAAELRPRQKHDAARACARHHQCVLCRFLQGHRGGSAFAWICAADRRYVRDADAERAFSDMLLLNQADGLILNTNGLLEGLLPSDADGAQFGPPVVSCGGHKGIELPTVRTDDVLGGRLAAQHLVELGHRDLIQVCGPLHMNGFERRFRGFNEVLIDSGIQCRGDRSISGVLSVDFGLRAAVRSMEGGDLPTAVFVHNDETATGSCMDLRGQAFVSRRTSRSSAMTTCPTPRFSIRVSRASGCPAANGAVWRAKD